MRRSSFGGARPLVLLALFALQAFCVLALVGDVAGDFIVTQPTAEQPGGDDDRLEAAVVAALVLGLGFSAYEIWRMLARQHRLEDQIRAASGAFHDVLDAHFDRWGLTAAERDVAVLALKGLSIAEIAALRDSRDGTVKAQCSAIYRKADVSGRPQLLSLFIEELLGEGLPPASSASAESAC